jgi:hypothetical protein
MRPLPRLLALSALTLVLTHRPADAELPAADAGVFQVTIGGHTALESFSYSRSGDSLTVTAETRRPTTSSTGVDTLHKLMTLVLGAEDGGLRRYASNQDFRGHSVARGLTAYDSTLSCFRQVDGLGEGNIYSLPPGRVFVMDGMLFTLIDVVCRSFAGTTFESRLVQTMSLGARDTVQAQTLRSMGTDTLRWGGRPVQTRRLELTDGPVRFALWAAPDGRMLRLTQREMGVAIERLAPAIKSRAPRPPKR